jgi:hypothetical protein
MWAGGRLLPVWTNFNLGLLHRRPRIESCQKQKTSTGREYFKSSTTGGANHIPQDYILQLYHCATLTSLTIHFIFKALIVLHEEWGNWLLLVTMDKRSLSAQHYMSLRSPRNDCYVYSKNCSIVPISLPMLSECLRCVEKINDLSFFHVRVNVQVHPWRELFLLILLHLPIAIS